MNVDGTSSRIDTSKFYTENALSKSECINDFTVVLKKSLDGMECTSGRRAFLKKKREVLICMLSGKYPFVNDQMGEAKKNLLQRIDLEHVDCSGLDFSDTNLQGSNLKYADMTNAILRHTDLSGATIDHADFSNVTWEFVNVENIKLAFDSIDSLPGDNKDKYKILGSTLIEHIKSLDVQEKSEFHRYSSVMSSLDSFRDSLPQENAIQRRLKALDNIQLLLFLTCVYVEDAHPYHQPVAYHHRRTERPLKDETYRSPEMRDDQANMIAGYALFMSALKNELVHSKDITKEQQSINVKMKIIELSCLLLNNKPTEKVFPGARYGFEIISEDVYNASDISRNRRNDNSFTLKTLGFDINIAKSKVISLIGIKERFLFCSDAKYSSDRDYNIEDMLVGALASKLVDAYDQKDMAKIYHLASDFQYYHLYPDANGRISQIIRDCFAICLGQPPFSPLHYMSLYMCLMTPPDKEHMKFMQENTEEILCAVERQALTPEIYRRSSPESIKRLLARAQTNPAIEHDVSVYLRKIGGDYDNAKSAFESGDIQRLGIVRPVVEPKD